jgi:very-short-patch-repair endonuclease
VPPRPADPEQRNRRRATPTLRTPDRSVAAIAGRQYGVVSVDDLRTAGITEAGVRRRVAAGRLHRLHRGVYAVGHRALTPLGLLFAAWLACGRTAVVSHRSAAVLWGLLAAGGPPHVTAPNGRGRRAPGIAVHGGRLGRDDVTIRQGLPVTSWGRTMLDCAATMPVADVVRLIERSQSLRVGSTDEMLHALTLTPGHHGLRTLRAALLIARPQDLLTRSQLERRALTLVRRAGLPRPEANVRLAGFEVDLLWREARVVVELDGRAWHDTAEAFERDRWRDATLTSRGWRVLRFSWRQVVNEPRWVAATIATTLGVRRQAVA